MSIGSVRSEFASSDPPRTRSISSRHHAHFALSPPEDPAAKAAEIHCLMLIRLLVVFWFSTALAFVLAPKQPVNRITQLEPQVGDDS
jgi:hypothetical protein